MIWQHEELRPDIEAYARSEGVDFERAWETLHTSLAEQSDEQIALSTHMIGWSIRHYGLDDAVSFTIDRKATS